MSRTPGAKNKDKRFRAALLRYADADPKRLDELAERTWALAMGGDLPSIREIADRIDGKVAQTLIGDANEDAVQIDLIRRIIVKPGHSDGGSVPPAAEPG